MNLYKRTTCAVSVCFDTRFKRIAKRIVKPTHASRILHIISTPRYFSRYTSSEKKYIYMYDIIYMLRAQYTIHSYNIFVSC